MSGRTSLALVTLVSIALAGCGKDDHDKEAQPVRPVLSVVVKPENQKRLGFAGVIEPRYQTDRAFQVLGRILSRSVDVGDVVEKGQKLAENDPLQYALAVGSSEAELSAAKSQLEKTTAQWARTAALVKQRVETQADLDSDQQAKDSADASVRQAQANLTKAQEQLGYTTLTSDLDGVVTRVYAQVGQIASPGMTVMTLARTDVREAVVDVPEDVARSIVVGTPFEISLQADPTIDMTGKVREIAPEADATTRLRRLKITLDRSVDPFRLGATITATPTVAAGSSAIAVPVAALFESDGATRVWIVDEKAKSVRSVKVEVTGRDANVAHIGGAGLAADARVVVAGVHTLKEGQAIKIDGGAGN